MELFVPASQPAGRFTCHYQNAWAIKMDRNTTLLYCVYR